MERVRWRTGSPRSRWWRGWMLWFTWGLLLVVLVRGAVYLLDDRNAAANNGEIGQAEDQQQVLGNEASEQNAAVEESAAPNETDKQPMKEAQSVGSSGSSGTRGINILTAYDRMWVNVYLTKEKRIEKMPIELYVRGVLAGEMPIDFELEALKAQAIAARTYIYKRMKANDHSGLSGEAEKADVDDTVMNQVYVPLSSLLSRWSGTSKEKNLEKLNEAVAQTKGQIVTYEGEPIQAAFFSTSNGYTENASDYWDLDLPYLRSVASPWDKSISPSYKETVTMSLNDFSKKLGIKKSAVRQMRILDTTAGKRIKTVMIGREMLSGREIREKLGLASSQFNWTILDDEIQITTFGYGHGVGMSQWGANGMAQSGGTAAEILAHYYSGTQLSKAKGLVD
ncbi:stage II sporulation protein D [Paenibacillus sp. CF384]|uniref:stage II sporulation protein D n=1 Tax=Paenibacillus sp. CF384 TaxID=1884382 RepID=UPI000894BF3E|nr:stage II sporulation protein D [Paenibacillus sp. CF384]SDX27540.1 stage II sporulation protein D [Paenibacillus sp. CF384]